MKTTTSKSRLLAVILAICFLFLQTACGTSEPFDTVERLADAMNAMDIEGMQDCLDPRITDTFGEVLKLFGGQSIGGGIKIPDLSGLLSGSSLSYLSDLASEYVSEYAETEYYYISVEEISTVYKGEDRAAVTAKVMVENEDGEVTETTTESFNLIYLDGEWYITMTLSDWQSFAGSL